MIHTILEVLLLIAVAFIPFYLVLHQSPRSSKPTVQQLLEQEQEQRRKQLERDLEQEREREEDEERQRLEKLRVEEERIKLEKSKHRERVIQELLTTEETYLKQLENLNEYFISPIREKQLMQSKIFDLVFPVDINIIRNINNGFCKQLKKIVSHSKRESSLSRRNLKKDSEEMTIDNIQQLHAVLRKSDDADQTDWTSVADDSTDSQSSGFNSFTMNPDKNALTNLADLMLHYAPAFKLYVGFISKYGKCIETLSKETEKNKKLNIFLEEQLNVLIEKHENGTVHDYLVTMIQRIPRYRLILEDLLKHTEQDNEARAGLEGAIKNISETAKFCNEKDREYATAVQMFALQAKIHLKNEHRSPGRRLVEQFTSEENKIQVLKKGKQDASGKVDLYIFNDAIAFEKKFKPTSVTGTLSLLKKNQASIQYIRVNTLSPYGTVTDVEITSDDCTFKVATTYRVEESSTTEKKEFAFVCESAQLCQQIVDVIEKAKSRK